MSGSALIVGNSDGIGLALTRELLARGWSVRGIADGPSPVEHPSYVHEVVQVESAGYAGAIDALVDEDAPPDVCVYCVGTCVPLNLADLSGERGVFEVNLLGLVDTVARVLPPMVARGCGHIIGLSSAADDMLSRDMAAYHASKAAFSLYLESLALAARPAGVAVTNVRFGYVDTAMSTERFRPFVMSPQRAARHLLKVMRRKPARYTAPWLVTPLVKLKNLGLRLGF